MRRKLENRKSRRGRGVCWHFTAEWCEGWWVTPGIKCHTLPRGEAASRCIPPQSGWWVRAVFMEGPHAGYSQGEESRRERWKSNYFPLSRCLPSCVRQIRAGGKKKIEAHSPSTRNQLGSLGVRISDLCPRSVSAPQYSLIHPRPLSLRGGLILWASSFQHIPYEICPHQKNLRSTETPFNVFNRNESRRVTALRNFCFGSIPLHLFPWLFCALRARCIEGFDV